MEDSKEINILRYVAPYSCHSSVVVFFIPYYVKSNVNTNRNLLCR